MWGAYKNSQKDIRNSSPCVSLLMMKTESEWDKLIEGRNPEKLEPDHEEEILRSLNKIGGRNPAKRNCKRKTNKGI